MEPFDLAVCLPELPQTSSTMIDQVVVDSRRIASSRALFIALPGQQTDGHAYVQQALQAGASYAIVSRHYPPGPHLIHVDNPLATLQEIARQYRLQRHRTAVVGITGSVGKTMLKDLLQAILAKSRSVFASPGSFNSQVGVPLSLLQITDTHDLALIEAGISHPGEMERLAHMILPQHMILTPLSDNHIATMGSIEHTTQEKLKLAEALPPNGWLLQSSSVYHQINTTVYHWNAPDSSLPQLHTWHKADLSLGYKLTFPDQTISQHHTQGYAYVPNLFAIASCAAWLLKASSSDISETLASSQPELMRTELFQTRNGGWIINNPYCSDPQSLENSLRHFVRTHANRKKTVLFGGLRNNHAPHQAVIEQTLKTSGIELSHGTLQNWTSRIDHDETLLITGPKKIPLDQVFEATEDGISATTCFIDLSAIEHNLNIVKTHLQPNVSLMAIVKAVGYGTDARLLSTFLENCGIKWLGVALVDEGISLKQQGVSQTIFCLNVAPYEIRKAVKANLELGVDSIEIIEALQQESERQAKITFVHLHIDTGMSRFGCRPEDAASLAQTMRSYPNLFLNGVFSHYSSADDPSQDPHTHTQNQRLEHALQQIGPVPYVHVSNSAGTLRHGTPYNMVRVGLAMYGCYPGLKPALTLTSRIAGITECHAGDTVGYGCTHTLTQDTRLAVIPIGYADGLHRRYEKSSLLIRGQPAPIVGHICMDYCMVDVTHIPHTQSGNPALIFGSDEFGHHRPIEQFAQSGQATIHELVSSLGSRIRRVFTLN